MWSTAVSASPQRPLLECDKCLLQLHLDPHLADIRSAFLASKKSIVEQLRRSLKVPGFRQIQNQFKN